MSETRKKNDLIDKLKVWVNGEESQHQCFLDCRVNLVETGKRDHLRDEAYAADGLGMLDTLLAFMDEEWDAHYTGSEDQH